MKTLRNTLLGACLALPLAAATGHAQTIEQAGRTIHVPPGAVVVILPGPAAAPPVLANAAVPAPMAANAAVPAAAPMLRLIAEQQAMMAQQEEMVQRMIADMNAMFPPLPNPSQLLRAAFGAAGPVVAAGGPMLDVAAGSGACSESISIVQHGNSAPVITRSESGSGCGMPAATGAAQAVRQLRPAAPVAPAPAPGLLDIGYPPRPVATGVPPRA